MITGELEIVLGCCGQTRAKTPDGVQVPTGEGLQAESDHPVSDSDVYITKPKEDPKH